MTETQRLMADMDALMLDIKDTIQKLRSLNKTMAENQAQARERSRAMIEGLNHG